MDQMLDASSPMGVEARTEIGLPRSVGARRDSRMYQRGLASTADRLLMSGAGRHAIAFG